MTRGQTNKGDETMDAKTTSRSEYVARAVEAAASLWRGSYLCDAAEGNNRAKAYAARKANDLYSICAPRGIDLPQPESLV